MKTAIINTIVASIAFAVVYVALERDWMGLRASIGTSYGPAGVTQ